MKAITQFCTSTLILLATHQTAFAAPFFHSLGDVPGGSFHSEAHCISADGSVVVGHSKGGSGSEAFRWTADGEMVGLGDLPGGSFESVAGDVSADGSVVVGWGIGASGGEAILWDSLYGMRSMNYVLVNDFGLDLTGWTLTCTTSVSADGLTFVGFGDNPDGNVEAWIAHIPCLVAGGPPGACDVNRDGVEDGRDIAPMIEAVMAGSTDPLLPCANHFEDDGIVDAGDIPSFVDCLLADD